MPINSIILPNHIPIKLSRIVLGIGIDRDIIGERDISWEFTCTQYIPQDGAPRL